MKSDRPQYIRTELTKAVYKLGKRQLQDAYEILLRCASSLEELALVRGFQLKTPEVRLPSDESLVTANLAVTSMSNAGSQVESGDLQSGMDYIQYAIATLQRMALRVGKQLRDPQAEATR